MNTVSDLKKPSEIAQEGGVEGRETGRPTDMKDLENQAKSVKDAQNVTVCCCVDPYIVDEPSAPEANMSTREGDVFKHRVHFRTRVVCFNMCYNTENTTQTLILRASDGAAVKTITVDDLNKPDQYFLVRTEKCKQKHHDLKRYSVLGGLLVHLCSVQGLLSTCRKCLCIEDCVSTVAIETIRCERSLYSRRHF
jgi:hypothetical protein